MIYVIAGGIWFVLTTVAGALMWASQIGPDAAVLNLSLWAKKFGIVDPLQWLKEKSADRAVRRLAMIFSAIWLVLGGALLGAAFEDYVKPATSQQANRTLQTTPSIGYPPDEKATTIQWNQVFGTTRSIDRVFALLLDGRGPAFKSIRLKRAYLESAKTGEVIEMKIAGETPVDEAFPISEANPIPPNGFVRLVAVMNPADAHTAAQNGLINREFLDRWGSIWFNATYDDDIPPDRISFEMAGYFPEISGPHATRR
ncbi:MULTISPECIES: hypothetical protein [unclassified Bradyrhizobium]|uniref:hypothetical protein n=1 Tax=unclassified Bradyrhizobium TaxID=2631580 RepID=UPI002915F432|nr:MULTISPECIES: hypothetical protein [unclassified Bradyrhizobium]